MKLKQIFLDYAARLIIWCGKEIARIYTFSWTSFNYYWFDHRFDFLNGPANWFWTERGIIAYKEIPVGGKVLDLCCGDGIYPGLFYCRKAKIIDAIDKDSKAIDFARKHYKMKNVNYYVADVINDPFPLPKYDVICLFACIEHFSPIKGDLLLDKIRKALKSNGKLVGSTPLFNEKGSHNDEHENEFLTEGQLKKFLKRRFRFVETWQSPWKRRIECYFIAHV